jgi:WD40 repeat protein
MNPASTDFSDFHAIEIELRKISELLPHESPDEDDLIVREHSRLEGSCHWLLQKSYFQSWLDESGTSILWLYGIPGSGKSTLSSFAIDYLRKSGRVCQLFFFSYSERSKHQVASCLRSLARQIANSHASVRHALASFHDGINSLGSADARTVWQKLFVNTIFKVEFDHPLCWVIDALDESDGPTLLTQLLGSMQPRSSIKIFITSRHAASIADATAHARVNVVAKEITTEDTLTDVTAYAMTAIADILYDEEKKKEIVESILHKAAGCFLWVRLAVEDIRELGFTQAGIQAALETVPTGMDCLYQRILQTITSRHSENRKVAKVMILWCVCSIRPLSVDELRFALQSQLGPVLNMERAITHTCANLLYIDRRNRVQLIHQTARTFLLQNTDPFFRIVTKRDHAYIACVCLDYLGDESMRFHAQQARHLSTKLDKIRRYPFALYAIEAWSEHLRLACPESDTVFQKLVKFLRTSILTWVALLSSSDQVGLVIQSTRNLKAYLERRARFVTPGDAFPIGSTKFVDAWAIDLIRLATKFGKNLVLAPFSLFQIIPQFCPTKSMVRQQCLLPSSPFHILGGTAAGWNDCVARIRLQSNSTVTALASCEVYIALGLNTGDVFIYCTSTCQQFRKLASGSKAAIKSLQFGPNNDKIMTGGGKLALVWDLSTGKVANSFQSSDEIQALAFTSDGEHGLIITRNCTALTWDFGDLEVPISSKFHWMEREPEVPGRHRSFPVAIALSYGNRYLAVSYRGFPVSVWDLECNYFVGEVTRNAARAPGGCHNVVDTVDSLDFNRATGHLILGYCGGTMQKWDPFTEERYECFADAQTLVCSPDGSTIATGDTFGNIKLWNFDTFELIRHISTNDDTIGMLCFSPNGLRFYDIRDDYCSAWEPESLVHATKSDNDCGSFGPISPEIIDASINPAEPLSSLVIDPTSTLAGYGKEGGSVYIYTLDNQSPPKQIYSHAKGINFMAHAWSSSGKFMATADDSRTVILLQLSSAQDLSSIEATVLTKANTQAGIKQLLFDKNEKRLFVITRNDFEIWPTDSGAKRIVEVDKERNGYWIHQCSPSKSVISITTDQLIIFDYNDSGDSHSLPSRIVDYAQKSPVTSHVSNAGWCKVTGRDILAMEVTFAQFSSNPMRRDIVLYEWVEEKEAVSLIHLMSFSHIEFMIGICNNRRVVFLDKDFWVCSWDAIERPLTHDRHFFVPIDWINSVNRPLYSVTDRADVLVARDGELITIKGGLQMRH